MKAKIVVDLETFNPEHLPHHHQDGRGPNMTTLPRVAKPNMVMRSVRVPLTLWTAAKAKADERGENISDVVREALQRYVNRR